MISEGGLWVAMLAWPVVVCLALALLPKEQELRAWWFSLAGGLGVLTAVLFGWLAAPSMLGPLHLAVDVPWFAIRLGGRPVVSVVFALGTDRMAMAMLLLSGIVLVAGAVASAKIERAPRGFAALYLMLCLAVPGCFLALDAFLFYVFFEVMLIPMYFLVGLWGGPRREFAAIQFFIYTLAGSLLILAGFAVCYLFENPAGELVATRLPGTTGAGWAQALWPGHLGGAGLGTCVFWGLAVGFLIKLPAVPLHTWLPVAHVEAPTAVSVVLAGLLLKTGGYGLMRWVYPLMPAQAAEAAPWLAGLGTVSIVYGALLALGTLDMKRMIACSSVSHMGFVLLGLAAGTPEGYVGAWYQMFSHGIISAGLFVAAGVLQDRLQTRDMDAAGGLAQVMPRYAAALAALCFAGMGLPGFSGFVGEFLVLVSAFRAGAAGQFWLGWPLGVLVGLLITSGYFVWALRRLLLGPVYRREGPVAALADLTMREGLLLFGLLGLVILFGLVPGLLLG